MALLPRFRRSRRLMVVILVAVFLLGVQGGLAVLPIHEDGASGEGAGVDSPSPHRTETDGGSPVVSRGSEPIHEPASDAVAARPEQPAVEDRAVAVVSAPEPSSTATASPIEEGDAPPEDPAEPDVSADPTAPERPDPAEQRRRADADRLWGCVRTMAAEDLGVAFEAADAASRLELLPEGRQRLGAAWADLAARVRSRVGGALRDAASGDVASAARALSDLASIGGAGRELARSVVRDAAASLGVGWDPGLDVAVADVPRPGPLPRGLEVAFESAAGVRFEGVVRAERAGVVSVEVAGPGGRRFPTTPRSRVEPQVATVELALDQCAFALASGERAWAVAWWTRARALGADGARLALLSGYLGS